MSLYAPFEHRVGGKMYYSLHDILSKEEIESLGFVMKSRHSNWSFARFGVGNCRTCIMAVRIGELREPRAGEWYLGGGPAEAYKTRADLSTKFHILELCVVRRQIVTEYSLVDADVPSVV